MDLKDIAKQHHDNWTAEVDSRIEAKVEAEMNGLSIPLKDEQYMEVARAMRRCIYFGYTLQTESNKP